jgi:hypothetical protein
MRPKKIAIHHFDFANKIIVAAASLNQPVTGLLQQTEIFQTSLARARQSAQHGCAI